MTRQQCMNCGERDSVKVFGFVGCNDTQVGDAFGFLYLIAEVLFAMLLRGAAKKLSRALRQRNGR